MDIRRFICKSTIDITLNPIQKSVVECVVHRGENVFMTGPGGVGKSHTIRRVKETATRDKYVCHVTALTGTAAYELNCKAYTLHRWAGIGTGSANIPSLLRKVRANKSALKRWQTVDILVIDEISMMDAELFEKVDMIARDLRKNNKPFGDITILASGDFYQLPPVSEIGRARFCFESSLWFTTFTNNIELTHNYRQEGDGKFLDMLNQIRIGRIKKSTIKALETRIISNTSELDERDIKPTRLLPVKRTVNKINEKYFNLLHGDIISYSLECNTPLPIECGGFDKQSIHDELNLLKKSNNSRIPLVFNSRIGAQVMCTVNYDPELGIVNGSRGVIIKHDHAGPTVKFHNGENVTFRPHTIPSETIPGVSIRGIPLVYAWAITIHKCQGSTLDLCVVDLGRDVFEAGQAYVALSRVRSLDGLYITNFNLKSFRFKAVVSNFYKRIRSKST